MLTLLTKSDLLTQLCRVLDLESFEFSCTARFDQFEAFFMENLQYRYFYVQKGSIYLMEPILKQSKEIRPLNLKRLKF